MNHITVVPKDRPDFEIRNGKHQRVQENVLNYLYMNGGRCDFDELLPSSFHRKDDLREAINELLDKDKISEQDEYYTLNS